MITKKVKMITVVRDDKASCKPEEERTLLTFCLSILELGKKLRVSLVEHLGVHIVLPQHVEQLHPFLEQAFLSRRHENLDNGYLGWR